MLVGTLGYQGLSLGNFSFLPGYSNLGGVIDGLENEGIVMELPAQSCCLRTVHVSRHGVHTG